MSTVSFSLSPKTMLNIFKRFSVAPTVSSPVIETLSMRVLANEGLKVVQADDVQSMVVYAYVNKDYFNIWRCGVDKVLTFDAAEVLKSLDRFFKKSVTVEFKLENNIIRLVDESNAFVEIENRADDFSLEEGLIDVDENGIAVPINVDKEEPREKLFHVIVPVDKLSSVINVLSGKAKDEFISIRFDKNGIFLYFEKGLNKYGKPVIADVQYKAEDTEKVEVSIPIKYFKSVAKILEGNVDMIITEGNILTISLRSSAFYYNYIIMPAVE